MCATRGVAGADIRRAVLSLRQSDKFLLLRRRLARPVEEELAANENGRCGKVVLVTGVLFVASGPVIVIFFRIVKEEERVVIGKTNCTIYIKEEALYDAYYY